jgi:sulfur carrier protein
VQLVINGEHREVQDDLTVEVLVSSMPAMPEGRGVAVAVDGEVVPRGSWSDTPLRDGAQVEILAAVQGG